MVHLWTYIDSLLLTRLCALFMFHWFSSGDTFYIPVSHPEYHITFAYHISLDSFWLSQLFRLFLFLVNLTVLKSTDQIFAEYPSSEIFDWLFIFKYMMPIYFSSNISCHSIFVILYYINMLYNSIFIVLL